ncbi:hypothetical protein E2562_028185 [Oryza meyeriana var. granulata]|uniref:Protein kinase domain-containing protein n=1 Tax=Oryza meyeriana var. granulata TaxID=110450 RepID=A0A6G1CU34_9ORYZ|nr:hypothetical protein E2562_028185 [Oryza meyeriana var. granulata]
MDVSGDSILLVSGARVIRRAQRGLHDDEHSARTRGYMAPKYLEHGVVSPKNDVYSLDVMLLELVTGKDVDQLEADGADNRFTALNALATDLNAGDNDDMTVRRMEEFLDPAMAAAGSCPLELLWSIRTARSSPELAVHLPLSSGAVLLSRALLSSPAPAAAFGGLSKDAVQGCRVSTH